MNYKTPEDDTLVKASTNLGNARNARKENPESIEVLDEYIKANIEYYKVSKTHADS